MGCVRVESRRSEAAASLAYAVEAFAAREGLPPKYRRMAASSVLSSPTIKSLGDDRVRLALGLAAGSHSVWASLAETEDGRAIRSCVHACLFVAKRLSDAAYGSDCTRWRRQVRGWSVANQLFWDSEGRLVTPDSGRVAGYSISHRPPKTSDDNRFPDFDAMNRLAEEHQAHRSSSFPPNLTNHPQLFDARSMATSGGMI